MSDLLPAVTPEGFLGLSEVRFSAYKTTCCLLGYGKYSLPG